MWLQYYNAACCLVLLRGTLVFVTSSCCLLLSSDPAPVTVMCPFWWQQIIIIIITTTSTGEKERIIAMRCNDPFWWSSLRSTVNFFCIHEIYQSSSSDCSVHNNIFYDQDTQEMNKRPVLLLLLLPFRSAQGRVQIPQRTGREQQDYGNKNSCLHSATMPPNRNRTTGKKGKEEKKKCLLLNRTTSV